ncbi:MAG: hypothetical protein A3J65_02700 [Candidatus Buchananbacteria bacterium RIFCSPHIGHO2_02_FULL_45_11b]|uniref:Transposase IS116/IS110/IS902 C-terminal domain-containing protein n=4 Tax=Candidatus Buchananiibacteriota TaxID=1817903 RepID=A0A1G1YIB2_9BACT|nr:MAG: hypothetical protein A2663_01545 [Candidatus Buchananbacteria bacterium RIFCSPHIGHO2_01_FULL_46_12]OGY51217.1 MAG: hypothetical protein A3J65_02700 [Candidatus Buchananbacteria bacterium RIFCSPHIGHO2_02_FULL_45_11b]OGY52781.1 MAG: hypothetical protein A3B15_03615 [Candidatus Buchananbacteria bacterium RIFCSPLOWO2_01_FULL_45_31]OGY58322.1 MAG: hypothetical protein A3H67_00875 [Candidatus Buchananbacteria bacterium RIFCSPLOWO2_02_FULL_46_11b]
MKKAREESRIIGIAHRVKKTADNEARPTLVCILDRGKQKICQLETETDELDFLLGRFPVKFRDVEPSEDLSAFRPHQVKWKPVNLKAEGAEEKLAQTPDSQKRQAGKKWFMAAKAPVEFDGLKSGDTVSMCLGAGNYFVYALARHGQDIGARVFRVAPKRLKENRLDDNKDNDHVLLAELYAGQPLIFQPALPPDLSLIAISNKYATRMDAQKDRIAHEQRLWQRVRDGVFLNPEGEYPEGTIEDMIVDAKANSRALGLLQEIEDECNADLEKEVSRHPLYQRVFKGIIGFGIRIAAPVIAFVGRIDRFSKASSFKQFCAVAPNSAGEFQRQRRGEVMAGRPDIRQALWLFAEQANRRPDSEWGQVLLAEKARLRAKHPEAVIVERPDPKKPGKTKKVKLYTDGHIHNMARWHMLGKFCEQLFKDWNEFQEEQDRAEIGGENSSDSVSAAA